jgi:prefoldin subunit 5
MNDDVKKLEAEIEGLESDIEELEGQLKKYRPILEELEEYRSILEELVGEYKLENRIGCGDDYPKTNTGRLMRECAALIK